MADPLWKERHVERNPRHVISDFDPAARRGICAVCGPVDATLKNRGNGRAGPICLTNKRRRDTQRVRPKVPWNRFTGSSGGKGGIRYRMKIAEYERLYARQRGKCAICCEPYPELFIDHDHATGGVRGLLCRRCNIALGFLKDSPERCIRASKYLIKSNGAMLPPIG